MSLIISIVLNSLAVMLSAYIIPGATVDSFWTAVWVTIVMGVVNVIVKPVLTLLTLPLTIVTFGLFLFVINLLLLFLVDALIPGFTLDGILSAILFAITLSVVGSLAGKIA